MAYGGLVDTCRGALGGTRRERQEEGRRIVFRLPSQCTSGQYRGKLTSQNSIDLPSSFDVQIDLDVPRTISGHTLFMTRYGAGQRSLFHVLHCFAMLCDTCGYCQGMGPIAATLLCYFDPEVSYHALHYVKLHHGE
jgi:hypothetical protein